MRSNKHSCGVKVAQSVTSKIFNPQRILKSMDYSTGGMNDTAVDSYARIEKDSGLTNSTKGHSMLVHCHRLTHARKIANAFVQ